MSHPPNLTTFWPPVSCTQRISMCPWWGGGVGSREPEVLRGPQRSFREPQWPLAQGGVAKARFQEGGLLSDGGSGGVLVPPRMICGVQLRFKHKDPTWLGECVTKGQRVVPQRPPSSWPGSRGWSSCLAVASPGPCVHSGTTMGWRLAKLPQKDVS